MQISTYIEQSVDHELSGNIIDLCPVGALNNKPYRYRARAWEMTQHPLVSPHDCVGTNLYGHVLRGRLMRVVPRANDEINETWIADRDRFSCEGLYTERSCANAADQRTTASGARSTGRPRSECRDGACSKRGRPARCRADRLPGRRRSRRSRSTRSPRGSRAGSVAQNVDHRLRRSTSATRTTSPRRRCLAAVSPSSSSRGSVLVVGSNLRQDVPLIAHRLRKGAARRGTKVALIDPRAPGAHCSRSPRA